MSSVNRKICYNFCLIITLKTHCTRVEDNKGNLLVQWFLLSNNSRLPRFKLTQFLVRLSGRQMKHKIKFTAPAVLDGYLILLSAHELLQQVTPDEIA